MVLSRKRKERLLRQLGFQMEAVEISGDAWMDIYRNVMRRSLVPGYGTKSVSAFACLYEWDARLGREPTGYAHMPTRRNFRTWVCGILTKQDVIEYALDDIPCIKKCI